MTTVKKLNLVTAGFWTSDQCLSVYRAISAIISIGPVAVVLTLDPPDFIFFLTDWGLIMTCIYFWYMVVYTFVLTRPNTFRGLQRYLEVVTNEKVAVYLFALSWSTEVMISSCYWLGCIFFTIERNTNQKVSSYVIHTVPFLLLLGEIILNSIRYTKMHFVLLQPVYVSYGIVNWLYVFLKLGGPWIYPNVTWDNWATPFSIGCAEIACLVGFMLGYGIGEWKHSRRTLRESEDSLSARLTAESIVVQL